HARVRDLDHDPRSFMYQGLAFWSRWRHVQEVTNEFHDYREQRECGTDLRRRGKREAQKHCERDQPAHAATIARNLLAIAARLTNSNYLERELNASRKSCSNERAPPPLATAPSARSAVAR